MKLSRSVEPRQLGEKRVIDAVVVVIVVVIVIVDVVRDEGRRRLRPTGGIEEDAFIFVGGKMLRGGDYKTRVKRRRRRRRIMN